MHNLTRATIVLLTLLVYTFVMIPIMTENERGVVDDMAGALIKCWDEQTKACPDTVVRPQWTPFWAWENMQAAKEREAQAARCDDREVCHDIYLMLWNAGFMFKNTPKDPAMRVFTSNVPGDPKYVKVEIVSNGNACVKDESLANSNFKIEPMPFLEPFVTGRKWAHEVNLEMPQKDEGEFKAKE